MEVSEAFDRLEEQIDKIGLIDAYGNPQEASWGFALVEKFGGQDASDLATGLERGLITAQDYFDHMTLMVDRFRIKHLSERFGERIEKQLKGFPRHRSIPLNKDFDPRTLGWEFWWDTWRAQVEVWADKQPEPKKTTIEESDLAQSETNNQEGATL